MVKVRVFKDKNYRSVYFDGKTVRFAIDPSKPVLDLDYPEFYDIKLTNSCNAGCPYCYQSSIGNDDHYDAVNMLHEFFGRLDSNQKPFQIAYGGGEPTNHPQFDAIMSLTRNYGISPNYTTNGMWVNTDREQMVIDTTKNYCEGVAVTCHEHLRRYWEPAAHRLIVEGIFTNFHNLISDKKSVDSFLETYKEFTGKVKYFVVLPLLKEGRAKDSDVRNDFDYFFEKLAELQDDYGSVTDIAFGANFYPYLHDKGFLKLSLYEPEIMSKYIDLKDGMVYKSSFDVGKPLKHMSEI